jgi:hypothetical protein
MQAKSRYLNVVMRSAIAGACYERGRSLRAAKRGVVWIGEYLLDGKSGSSAPSPIERHGMAQMVVPQRYLLMIAAVLFNANEAFLSKHF